MELPLLLWENRNSNEGKCMPVDYYNFEHVNYYLFDFQIYYSVQSIRS